MAVTVEIKNQQKKLTVNPRQIIPLIKKILRLEGVTQARLSFVFVTDRTIQALNRKFLNRDHPTDVLAFDYSAGRSKFLEGDIIISTVTAVANARRFGVSPHEEVVLYIIHGILHLRGYDDRTAAATAKMRRREEKIMKELYSRGVLHGDS